jgi:hypothetical protein
VSRKGYIFANGNHKKEINGSNYREDTQTNHRQHERASVEQDAATGGGIQVGTHHQAKHETGGI